MIPYIINVAYSPQRLIDEIYSEFYGLLFDVILFGIVITFIQISRDNNEIISHQLDIIDDFRDWDDAEASYRILGSIRRLQRIKHYSIDLSGCNLKLVTLRNMYFFNSKMNHVNFIGSTLLNIVFSNYKSNGFICGGKGHLLGCSFDNCKIKFNLQNIGIDNCLFKNVNLDRSLFNLKDITLSIFEEVDFSFGTFKVESSNLCEFINCKFDECVINKNWFDELSDPNNNIVGSESILEKYKLVEENQAHQDKIVKVFKLRSKNITEIPEPPVRMIGTDEVDLTVSPWERIGRCQVFK
ncbi:MAG: hypothetical protein IPL31_05770 [Saprospiraceae bacterium]|nr:hypothetical protein [Saprospiraceae bacterium]